jgi:H+-transporting ATPase
MAMGAPDKDGNHGEKAPLLPKGGDTRTCDMTSLASACGNVRETSSPPVTTTEEDEEVSYSAYDNPNDMRTSTPKHGPLAAPDFGNHVVPTQSGFKSVNMPGGEFERKQKLDEKQEQEAQGILALDNNFYPKDKLHNTNHKTGLTEEEAQKRLEKFGYNELPEKKKNIWWLLFLEFVSPMAIIVWLAIILEVVEAAIEISEGKDDEAHGDIIDVVTLLLLQFLNVFVGFFEEMKAENAIEELKKSLLPMAKVLRCDNVQATEGRWREIEAREVAIGDIVKMPLGGRVAADGINLDSRVQIDESQLTGESIPKTAKKGDRVLMGATVSVGESDMMAHETGRLTYFGKTADLLQDKQGQGHFEELLQLMLWVLVVLGIVVNIIIIVYLETRDKPPDFLSVLSFAAVLLIASIPIALRVVCVTTLALGARELSDQGAIVAKMNAVEEIATMTLLCSDKTGTLTQNKMVMMSPQTMKEGEDATEGWRDDNVSFDNLLQHATLAAKWWEPPEDALDTLILNYVAKYKCVQNELKALYAHHDDAFQPFDARKKRTQASIVVQNKNATAKTESLPEAAMGQPCDWKTFKLPMATVHDGSNDDGSDKFKEAQLTLPGGSPIATIINYHTDGRDFKVTKGAPAVLLKMLDEDEYDRIHEAFNASVKELGEKGIRSLAVAISYDNPLATPEDDESYHNTGWKMLGLIAFKDPVRPDSKATIDICRHLGISVKMVTGDQKLIAAETSRELGLDTAVLAVEKDKYGNTTPLPTFQDASELRKLAEDMDTRALGKKYGEQCFVAGGFAQVYPEHKYLIVSALQQKLAEYGQPVGMTGDGVNDAPALHRANIGIAVEGATKAAQGVADIVLTQPGLSAVVSSVVVSRKIFSRMKNFVVYRIACTLQLLFFFLIACLVYKPSDYCAEKQFFYLPVCALVTIVILNDGTIISVAFDNVLSSKAPEEWNMTVLTIVSSVVGGVALISSLIILHWSLECSGNYEIDLLASGAADANTKCQLGPNDKFSNFLTLTGMDATFGLDTLRYDSIKTLIYLKIALSDYLSLFNSRCQGWFFSRMPSWHVVVAALFSTVCSSLLSHWWPLGSEMTGIGAGVIAFVWLYTIVWGLIQDCFKVLTYYLINLDKKEAAKKSEKERIDEEEKVGPGKYINEDLINKQIEDGRKAAADAAAAREKENIVVHKEHEVQTAH